VDDGDIPQAKVFNLVRDLDAKADRLNGVVTPLMEPGVGGRLTGMAVDPFDSDHIVISGDLLGVGYTFDRGEHWYRSQGLTGYETGSITFDKKRPGVVWAATMSGPELSMNGGIVFERKIKGLPTSGQEYFRPMEIVIPHPTDPDIYYGAAGSHRDWKTSTSDVSNFGLFYRFNVSTDTWTTLATIVADGNIHAAAVNADATCFLVGGSFGLRKSADGTAWTDISTATGLPGSLFVRSIEAHPTDPNIFFLSTTGTAGSVQPGVFMTSNKGTSWTNITNDIPTPSLSLQTTYRVLRLAGDGSSLWVGVPNVTGQTSGTHDIVFKTDNPGVFATWTVGMDNSMKPAGAWPPGSVHRTPSPSTPTTQTMCSSVLRMRSSRPTAEGNQPGPGGGRTLSFWMTAGFEVGGLQALLPSGFSSPATSASACASPPSMRRTSCTPKTATATSPPPMGGIRLAAGWASVKGRARPARTSSLVRAAPSEVLVMPPMAGTSHLSKVHRQAFPLETRVSAVAARSCRSAAMGWWRSRASAASST
jgi:hypothetical protein